MQLQDFSPFWCKNLFSGKTGFILKRGFIFVNNKLNFNKNFITCLKSTLLRAFLFRQIFVLSS